MIKAAWKRFEFLFFKIVFTVGLVTVLWNGFEWLVDSSSVDLPFVELSSAVLMVLFGFLLLTSFVIKLLGISSRNLLLRKFLEALAYPAVILTAIALSKDTSDEETAGSTRPKMSATRQRIIAYGLITVFFVLFVVVSVFASEDTAYLILSDLFVVGLIVFSIWWLFSH